MDDVVDMNEQTDGIPDTSGARGSEESRPALDPELPWTRGRMVAMGLAGISTVTAVIHFAVAGSHFQQYWLFGVFMLVAGWCQLGLAVLAVARPSRALWWAGAVGDAAIVAVYIVTRTVGDLVGPTPHAVEPVGFGDLACTVLEAAVVVACAWLLVGSGARAVVDRRRALGVAGAVGGLGAIVLSVALVAGGPEMVMAMSPSSSSPGSATTVRAVSLATTSPAGAITMPDPTMQMAAGMQMASSTACDAAPTAAQQEAAVKLVDQSWAAVQPDRSLAAAQAAGYVPLTPPGRAVVHYINPSAYEATLGGGPVLDIDRPQSLVYANTPQGAVLVAAMYLTTPGGPTPTPGGCLTQWHVHTNLCLGSGALRVTGVVSPARPTCPTGSHNQVTPPMLHVWFVPIPGGPLAIDAPDAAVVRAAEQVSSPVNARA